MLGRLFAPLLGPRLEIANDELRALLPPGVSLRRNRWVPRLGGWLGKMRGPAAAVTLRRTILLHPHVTLTPRLLAHELAHVRQWESDLLFPFHYTAETLRRGYRMNRYEQQAREAETQSSHLRSERET